jgi:hypothetical protein
VGKAIDERIIRRGPWPDVIGEVAPNRKSREPLTVINGRRSVTRPES